MGFRPGPLHVSNSGMERSKTLCNTHLHCEALPAMITPSTGSYRILMCQICCTQYLERHTPFQSFRPKPCFVGDSASMLKRQHGLSKTGPFIIATVQSTLVKRAIQSTISNYVKSSRYCVCLKKKKKSCTAPQCHPAQVCCTLSLTSISDYCY